MALEPEESGLYLNVKIPSLKIRWQKNGLDETRAQQL